MKTLIIYGSPDKDGTGSRLGRSLTAGLSSEQAEIKEINIYDYKVADTWLNYFGDALKGDFSKAGDDDMGSLREMMLASEIIVLVSPIYWYQLSGRMKTFVDRWSDFINSDFSSDLAGKGLALASSHSGLNVMNSSNYLQLAMEATARFLGMTWLGGVEAPINLPGGSGPHESHFKLAEDFGQKLGRGENLLGLKVL